MLTLKPLVAALALGAALLLAPATVDARTTSHHATVLVKHKKSRHHSTHRKHTTKAAVAHKKTHPTALHAKTPAHTAAAKTTRHHPSL